MSRRGHGGCVRRRQAHGLRRRAGPLLAVTSIADAGSTRTFSARDRVPPTAPENLHVVSATPNLVYVAWDPSQDDGGVAGYVVYGDTGRAYVTAPAYTVTSLGCGESTAVAVAAYDRAGNSRRGRRRRSRPPRAPIRRPRRRPPDSVKPPRPRTRSWSHGTRRRTTWASSSTASIEASFALRRSRSPR